VFWLKSPHEQFEPRRSPEDDGHALIGPIAVRGARAGMTLATRGMVALMQRERGLDAPEALALASVVVDLRVTQIVNGSVGVHAVLRDDAWQ
jgi:acetamidase/formamidase